MKFRKTVDLWDTQTQDAIRAGSIKLQSGQWVQCGEGHKARFVGVSSGGSFWVAHYQGSPYSVNKRFTQMLENFNQRTVRG